MDERHLQQLMNEIHEFVTRDADQRDKEAKDRHKELLAAIDDSCKAIVGALGKVAEALRSR